MPNISYYLKHLKNLFGLNKMAFNIKKIPFDNEEEAEDYHDNHPCRHSILTSVNATKKFIELSVFYQNINRLIHYFSDFIRSLVGNESFSVFRLGTGEKYYWLVNFESMDFCFSSIGFDYLKPEGVEFDEAKFISVSHKILYAFFQFLKKSNIKFEFYELNQLNDILDNNLYYKYKIKTSVIIDDF